MFGADQEGFPTFLELEKSAVYLILDYQDFVHNWERSKEDDEL